jgi:hypothetical protein
MTDDSVRIYRRPIILHATYICMGGKRIFFMLRSGDGENIFDYSFYSCGYKTVV